MISRYLYINHFYSGIDIGVNIKKELCKVNGVPYDPRAMVLGGTRNSPIVDILFEHGRFGRKSGENTIFISCL